MGEQARRKRKRDLVNRVGFDLGLGLLILGITTIGGGGSLENFSNFLLPAH